MGLMLRNGLIDQPCSRENDWASSIHYALKDYDIATPRVETPGYQQKPVKTGSRAHFPNLL
jgi:hypothetical protein